MQYQKISLDKEIAKKARLLSLAGDETRIRILCFMFKYKKACVSDIAESLGQSIQNVSQHLRLMLDNGFFTTERMGNNICYILKDTEFIRGLEEIICKSKTESLLTSIKKLWQK